jgi:hypothetical protein
MFSPLKTKNGKAALKSFLLSQNDYYQPKN